MDFRKNKDAARLHEMLWTWREQAAKLEAGEISQEDYDRWRYHYPEYDNSQIRAKVPPDLDSIYDRFGVDYDLLSLLMRREKDAEGNFKIRWGEQKIA